MRWYNQNLAGYDDYSNYYGYGDEYVFGDYGYGPVGDEYDEDYQSFVQERTNLPVHNDHELWGDDDIVIGGVDDGDYDAYYFLGDGDDILYWGEGFDDTYGEGG